MVKINSIKKIINNDLLQIKKIKAGNNDYENAKKNFELLFLFLTEFRNISYDLETVCNNIFEIRFKNTDTKESVLEKDSVSFLEYVNNIEDIDGTFMYKEIFENTLKQKVFKNLNEFLSLEKTTKYMQERFDILYTKIKYIEEFEIIKNRLMFFFNCEEYFKQQSYFVSFNSDKEKESYDQAAEEYVFRKKILSFLKKEKIDELNNLSNIFIKEEIEEKEKNIYKTIEENKKENENEIFKISEEIKYIKNKLNEMQKPEDQNAEDQNVEKTT